MNTVVNNSAKNRFEYCSKDGTAICEYEELNGVWTITHTLVPDSMRGQGVAAKLTEFALNYVDALNGKIVPRCSYTAAYIDKHPSYKHLLVSERN